MPTIARWVLTGLIPGIVPAVIVAMLLQLGFKYSGPVSIVMGGLGLVALFEAQRGLRLRPRPPRDERLARIVLLLLAALVLTCVAIFEVSDVPPTALLRATSIASTASLVSALVAVLTGPAPTAAQRREMKVAEQREQARREEERKATIAKATTAVAEGGAPQAQLALGRIYITGNGLTRDLVLAYMWLQLAAASHDPDTAPKAVDARDTLAASMTPEQIEHALGLARSREATKRP